MNHPVGVLVIKVILGAVAGFIAGTIVDKVVPNEAVDALLDKAASR